MTGCLGVLLAGYAAPYRRVHGLTELGFGVFVTLEIDSLLSLLQGAGADFELLLRLVYVVGAAYAVDAAFDNPVLCFQRVAVRLQKVV